MSLRMAVLCVAVASCAGQSGEESATPIAEESIVGVAGTTGTTVESWTELRTETGVVRIVGPREPEVRALQGSRLLLVGAHVDQPGRSPAFHVTDYDVLEIDGEVPVVGTLLRVDGDFWIAEPDSVGGERLQLIGVPSSIGEATGGKIWVVGARGSSEIRVQSYGVIRRPPGS